MKVFPRLAVITLAVATGYLLRGVIDERSLEPDSSPLRTYRAPAQPGSSAPAQRINGAGAKLTIQTGSQSPAPQPSIEFEDLLQQPSVFATLHLAFELAASADLDALARMASEALSYDDPLYRYNIADIFVERMTSLDVNAALDFVESLPPTDRRAFLISSILSTWARVDEEAVFAYFASIDNDALKQQIGGTFLQDRHRSEAFRLAVQDQMGPMGAQIARQLKLSNSSPDVAFREALGARGPQSYGELMQAGLRWYQQDPDTALQEILAIPASRQRSMALQGVLQEMTRNNPQRALQFMEDTTGEDSELAAMILRQVAASNPALSLPYIESYTERTGDTGPLAQMLGEWVQQDPDAAVAYADQLPGDQREQALYSMAVNYVSTDPRRGLEWLLSTQDVDSPNTLANFVRLTPEAAAVAESMLTELVDPAKRSSLASSLARHKAETDPAAALQWLAQYPEIENYGAVHAGAVSQLAERDPQAAAAALDDRWSDPEMMNSFQTISYSWLQRDPDAALAWVDQLPDSPGRNAALEAMVGQLGHRDYEKARSLLRELPEGPGRNRAIISLATDRHRGDRPEDMRDTMIELGLSEQEADNFLSTWYR